MRVKVATAPSSKQVWVSIVQHPQTYGSIPVCTPCALVIGEKFPTFWPFSRYIFSKTGSIWGKLCRETVGQDGKNDPVKCSAESLTGSDLRCGAENQDFFRPMETNNKHGIRCIALVTSTSPVFSKICTNTCMNILVNRVKAEFLNFFAFSRQGYPKNSKTRGFWLPPCMDTGRGHVNGVPFLGEAEKEYKVWKSK